MFRPECQIRVFTRSTDDNGEQTHRWMTQWDKVKRNNNQSNDQNAKNNKWHDWVYVNLQLESGIRTHFAAVVVCPPLNRFSAYLQRERGKSRKITKISGYLSCWFTSTFLALGCAISMRHDWFRLAQYNWAPLVSHFISAWRHSREKLFNPCPSELAQKKEPAGQKEESPRGRKRLFVSRFVMFVCCQRMSATEVKVLRRLCWFSPETPCSSSDFSLFQQRTPDIRPGNSCCPWSRLKSSERKQSGRSWTTAHWLVDAVIGHQQHPWARLAGDISLSTTAMSGFWLRFRRGDCPVVHLLGRGPGHCKQTSSNEQANFRIINGHGPRIWSQDTCTRPTIWIRMPVSRLTSVRGQEKYCDDWKLKRMMCVLATWTQMAVRAGVNGKLDAKVARCQVGRVLRQFDSKRIVIYANVT